MVVLKVLQVIVRQRDRDASPIRINKPSRIVSKLLEKIQGAAVPLHLAVLVKLPYQSIEYET